MRIPPTTPLTSNNVDKLPDSSLDKYRYKMIKIRLHNRVKEQDNISNMTIIEQLACLCGQYSTTATIEKCVSHQKMQKANGVDSTSLFDLKRGLFNTLCFFIEITFHLHYLEE